MELETLADMFRYDMEAMYYVETELVDVLDELADDANNEQLSRGFSDHREETREHVERLERVFEELGAEPSVGKSATFDGLREDRRRFREQTDSEQMQDLFDMQAGIKTERLEISGYEGLLVIANKLGYGDEVTDHLEDNLSTERSTLRELEGLSKGSKVKSMLGQLLS